MSKARFLQIHEHDGAGYLPLVDFEKWRVALMNDAPNWLAENLTYLQKHNESDEVFVLLEGDCTLIVSPDENDAPQRMIGIRLQKNKVYNIPKGVWHSHFLMPGTRVLVVENSDTTPLNSPKVPLPHPVNPETLTYSEQEI